MEFNILYPFATFLFLVAKKGAQNANDPLQVQLTKKGSNVYKTFHFIKNEFYFQYLNLKRFLILNLYEFWASLKN